MKRITAMLLALWLLLALCACGSRGTVSQKPPENGENTVESGGEEGLPNDPIDPIPAKAPPRLIAHAGGSVYGYRLTNSLEALDTAYANGHRYIELDFECTSDGAYVLIHDWDSMARRLLFSPGQRSRQEFLTAETFMDLTLLDLEGLLRWMAEHGDCYIITDAKCENPAFLKALYEAAGECRQRFIPQVYTYEQYEMAREVGFSSVILTLYCMEDVREEQVIAFAREQKPWAITIPERYLTATLLQELARQEIAAYTHTVNDLSYYETWREQGLWGIYTDHFWANQWPD